MSIVNHTVEAAYATKPNVVHPDSERGAAGEPRVLAAEAKAAGDLANINRATVTVATIKRGR